MALVKFTERKGRFTEAQVTIGRSGIIGITSTCYEEFFSGKKKAVFYFDSETGEIGIEPTNEDVDYAYPIRGTKGGSSYYVSGVAFLRKFKIFPKERVVYDVRWDEKNKLIIAKKRESATKRKRTIEEASTSTSLFDSK